MIKNVRRFYGLLIAACAISFTWLLLSASYMTANQFGGESLCLIKHATGIPCPSCGSTRSAITLFGGDFIGAWMWNPFGFLIAAILIITPIWLIYDLFTQRQSMVVFYQHSELFFRKKTVAIPLVILVLINWIWNIHKGL
jgi:TRAP-type C4-dicarboxylate transport system permease small subunit